MADSPFVNSITAWGYRNLGLYQRVITVPSQFGVDATSVDLTQDNHPGILGNTFRSLNDFKGQPPLKAEGWHFTLNSDGGGQKTVAAKSHHGHYHLLTTKRSPNRVSVTVGRQVPSSRALLCLSTSRVPVTEIARWSAMVVFREGKIAQVKRHIGMDGNTSRLNWVLAFATYFEMPIIDTAEESPAFFTIKSMPREIDTEVATSRFGMPRSHNDAEDLLSALREFSTQFDNAPQAASRERCRQDKKKPKKLIVSSKTIEIRFDHDEIHLATRPEPIGQHGVLSLGSKFGSLFELAFPV